MKVRLAYPDCLVEVNGEEVYAFCGRLFKAPLSEVQAYVEGKSSVLPELIKQKAYDIANVLNQLGMRKNYSTAQHYIQAV